MRKQRGAYYTPERLANWLVSHMESAFSKKMRILEPGCGDGAFLTALNDVSAERSFIVDAVELNEKAIYDAKKHKHKRRVNFVNEDFLFWNSNKKYDLVIGNPPYVV